jgi:hypothetical protein
LLRFSCAALCKSSACELREASAFEPALWVTLSNWHAASAGPPVPSIRAQTPNTAKLMRKMWSMSPSPNAQRIRGFLFGSDVDQPQLQ